MPREASRSGSPPHCDMSSSRCPALDFGSRRVLVPYLTLTTNPTLGSQQHQTPNHHVYHEPLHEDKASIA
ncbi:hypothetical protein GE21DRAFT_1219731 [Neurospora crassa]|nr:hypothetical protein GE21DRAFT_1219731 [Neurospora crassa]